MYRIELEIERREQGSMTFVGETSNPALALDVFRMLGYDVPAYCTSLSDCKRTLLEIYRDGEKQESLHAVIEDAEAAAKKI